MLYLASNSTLSSNSGAKHSNHWAICDTISVRAQEMCPIRSGPYVAFWWQFVFHRVHRWRYTSLETRSLFACVYVWGKGQSESVIHHSCSIYPVRHRGGSSRAEWSVCQCDTAVAICTANWASPREQVTVLSRPIRNVAHLCQPCMTTSCLLD